MPFPKLSSGRVDPQLTSILLAYTNPDFVADRVLPTVPNLKEESGVIGSIGNAHLRVYSSKRALHDQSAHRITFEYSNDGRYAIDYYDLDAYVPDRMQDQLQLPFDARNVAQMTVMDALKLERENALATALTDTSILTKNQTLSASADKYTDPVNSTPDQDFDTARDSVQSLTGREANKVIMSRAVANALRRHPWFLEISKVAIAGGGGKAGQLSEQGFIDTLKAWYQLDDVIITKTIKVTSQQGQGTVTKSSVWGDDVVFFYAPSGPSLFTPSFGYSFQLAGHNLRTTVRREPLNDKGDLVGVDWAYQDNILDVNSAYLIKSAV